MNAAAAGAADQARTLGREAFAMMEESGDIAGFSVASVNLGVAELLLADLPAALIWLDRALAVFPIPGGHRSLGWLHPAEGARAGTAGRPGGLDDFGRGRADGVLSAW